MISLFKSGSADEYTQASHYIKEAMEQMEDDIGEFDG